MHYAADARLLVPIAPDHRLPNETTRPVLDELAGLSVRACSSHLPSWATTSSSEVKVVDADLRAMRQLRGDPFLRWKRPLTLDWRAQILFDPQRFASADCQTPESMASLGEFCVASLLERTAGDLVLVACLARPDIVHPLGAAVSCGSYQGKLVTHGVVDSTELAREKSWPPILQLNCATVWDWLQKLDGFKDGVGKNPVGRAISALSHLIFRNRLNDEHPQIFWSLLGLEALFARGHGDLQAQLLAKSEVLLGPRTAHHKTFKKIYGYRSRLVHGDIDLPLAYSINDGLHEDHFADLEANANAATALLLASLQHLIRDGRHSIEFAYRIEP